MRRRSPGWWLQCIAVVHGALGVFLYRRPLGEILRMRVLRTVQGLGDRSTAFWFVSAAPLMWLGGRLLRSAEASDDRPAQGSAGAALTAVGIVGSAAMPLSGFWGIAAVGLWTLRRASRGRVPVQRRISTSSTQAL